MSGQIYGRHRTVSATMLIEALGESLQRIKDEDGATDSDIGRVLGKSKDSAERHRKGLGDMGVVSFLLGCATWNGRFSNDVLAKIGMKIVPLDADVVNERCAASALTRLLLEMSLALEDGRIDDRELSTMRGALEQAGHHIDQMRQRLALRCVAA